MTSRRTRLALACATAGACALGAMAASAQSSAVAVEAPGARHAAASPLDGVDIRGRGFGHGHGMSQYGARGAAAEGLGYRRILRFYYPGTAIKQTGAIVRVWISADEGRNTIVLPQDGLVVRDLRAKKTYRLPLTGAPARSTITLWRQRLVNGKVVVSYRTDRWRPFRADGAVLALRGAGVFRTASSLITLRLPGSEDRVYRGGMRFAGGRTINSVPLDGYLKGVIPAEMPASWPAAALRAQAVAARTYASFERQANLRRSYQLCDTSACQVYGGYEAEQPRANRAVDGTAGEILTFGGEPAFTQFSSSSGGWTARGSRPYLVAQADPYDDAAQNPVHSWRAPLDWRRIESAYPALGGLVRVRILDRDGEGPWGGRVTRVRLVGADQSRQISGDELRSLLGLRSTLFKLES